MKILAPVTYHLKGLKLNFYWLSISLKIHRQNLLPIINPIVFPKLYFPSISTELIWKEKDVPFCLRLTYMFYNRIVLLQVLSKWYQRLKERLSSGRSHKSLTRKTHQAQTNSKINAYLSYINFPLFRMKLNYCIYESQY